MRPARRATVEVDAYGGREFTGTVDSIAAATGARFSLLPPENATGNFVKVVQRVPVKIVLDAGPGSRAPAAARHVGGADDPARDEHGEPRRMAERTRDGQPVDRRDRGDVRHLHGGARHHRRQRVAAAHRRQPVGDDRRVDVGADVVPGRQRDHPAADRLARELLRPQAPADDVGRRASRSRRSSAASRRTCRCSIALPRRSRAPPAARMQPLSQAVLLEAFPPQERGKAMGFWGLGIVVAPILGPVLGGWLTDSYSWRWVFYINLPVGIASLVMTQLYVFDPPYLARESRADRLLGHRPAGASASARCSSCSTRARRTTGSRRTSSSTLAVIVARRRWSRFIVRELTDRGAGRRPARLQGPHLRHRRVPDDDARASCSTAAWCCCRSCCRRCSAIRRCRPASRWRRAAWARSS